MDSKDEEEIDRFRRLQKLANALSKELKVLQTNFKPKESTKQQKERENVRRESRSGNPSKILIAAARDANWVKCSFLLGFYKRFSSKNNEITLSASDNLDEIKNSFPERVLSATLEIVCTEVISKEMLYSSPNNSKLRNEAIDVVRRCISCGGSSDMKVKDTRFFSIWCFLRLQ